MVSGDTRAAAQLTLTAARSRIPYGRKARLSGSLKTTDGSPLSGQRVRIRVSGAGSSRTLAKVSTDSAGSFTQTFRLPFNRKFQAGFKGIDTLRPAQSNLVAVGVRPRVTAALSRAAARLKRRQRALVTGSVRPRKRMVLLLIDRRQADGSFRRTVEQEVPARSGQILASYRFKKSGFYRLRLGVERDARNLSARSNAIEVSVG
jgi:hypothetical protein